MISKIRTYPFYMVLALYLTIHADVSAAPAGGLSLFKADLEVSEDVGTANFSYGYVDSASSCGEELGCSVTLTSRNGSARAGTDYQSFRTTLRWSFGEGGFKPFSISIIDNDVLDGTRTFFVDVTNAVGIDPLSSSFSIDITDDEIACEFDPTLPSTDPNCLPPQFCPTVVDPVCGNDGVTYNNACEADVAGATVVFEGSCSDAPPTVAITSPTQGTVTIEAGQSISFASEAESPNPEFDPDFDWTFPGGIPSSSSLENPGSIRFDTPGRFTAEVTVTDLSNNKTDSDLVLITVGDAPEPDETISLTPDSDGVNRPELDMGVLTPDAEPIGQQLAIENGFSETVEFDQVRVSGSGFSIPPVPATINQAYFSKAEPLDQCVGRKALSSLPPGARCGIDITFDPSNLPPGLHAGLLTIETTVGQRTLELLAKVDGPQTLFAGGRLLNISTNGFVDPDGMVAGFIITGTEARRVVVMGENMNDLPDPELMLSDFSGDTVYALNDNWRDHPTAAQIEEELRAPGAELDSAFAITLEPGVYLAWLSGKNGQSGTGLVSVTDISAPPGSEATRLLNISTNGGVTAADAMVAGFIVSGQDSIDFVIMAERAGGSALNPKLRLTDFSGDIEFDSNNNWQDHPTASLVESLDRAPNSTVDAAFVVTLAPGVYLAWVEREDGQAGQGIVSITEVQAP